MGDIKNVGQEEHVGPIWRDLRQEIDLEVPSYLLNQVFLGCSQQEAEVDHHAVQAKADRFRRLTTTSVTDEKNKFLSTDHRVE